MLRVELLGGLHITLNGDPVTGFISSKAQALLCYLVLHPDRAYLRSTLALLFWGDKTDEDAATNLRQVIGNLKKLLEPYFEITRQSVAFIAAQPHWCDAAAFETTRDPALYRGELLAGFGLADAPDFDLWLTTERERLHELALAALRGQATGHFARGDSAASLASWQRLIALDPLAEDAHRQLMLALALNGQRSAALAQYGLCCELLERELGVEAEMETTRLYQRIRTARRVVNLPPETAPLIGRAAEARELAARLRDPLCRLITLVGLGGIGKTRFALHVAHGFADQTLHGAALVNLTSVETLDFFWHAVADGIGCALSREGTPRQQLLNFLREKHLLLVLDNFEQLIGVATDFLLEVTRAAPEVKLLITSRERLNLPGEHVLALAGLPIDASEASAQALFWATARRVRGDDLLADDALPAVTRICALVDGMPLAVELAAAWARLLSCDEIADEIATNLTALQATTRAGDARHASLRAVFDQSWNLFAEQEKRVLMALSLFVGGFTRAAADAVAQASLPLLLSLADKMLIRRDSGSRFTLHEMFRQYLAEQLALSSAEAAVQQTFLAYFVRYVEDREPRLKAAEQLPALSELDAEIDNLYAAWELAVTHRDAAALMRLLPGLALYHDFKANWEAGANLIHRAEAALDSASALTHGTRLSYTAFFAARRDQIDAMGDAARRCLGLLPPEVPAHLPAIARAFVVLGYEQRLCGNYPAAIQLYQQALDARARSHDDWGCAECLLSLSSIYCQHGDDAEALRVVREGLALNRVTQDAFQQARLQTMLAILLERIPELDAAEQLYHEMLAIYQQLNDLAGCSLVYHGLGNIAYFRGDYPAAQRWYWEAVTISQQLGTREWEGGTLSNLGEVARTLGEHKAALAYFRQAQTVFQQLGHQGFVDQLQAEIDATLTQMRSAAS